MTKARIRSLKHWCDQILEPQFIRSVDLANLAACSRTAYVFATHDELWRVLVLEEMHAHFKPESTWKATYLKTKYGNNARLGAPICVQGLYSDLLFQSFYCAAAPIEETWLAVENVARRSAKDMTLEGFRNEFEGPNVPVIITDAINDWSAMTKWTDKYLEDVCGSTTFDAGGFQFPLEEYLNYARTLQDDQPLFIFDKKFAGKVSQLARDYTVPKYFCDDYFAFLGEARRPDYRWLIIGPAKSGSSFHIDPNATNAWNGVIRGRKKWIMFPPGQVPPGIHPSEDGSEVSAPVSLMEWFMTFYKTCQKLPAHLKPLEGICREGEVMFVPHGWWHTVLNIEESIAVTQNFVSSCNVKSVLAFFDEKPDQVSGCPIDQRQELGRLFRDVLARNVPELFAKVNKELEEEYERKHRKSKWELLIDSGQVRDNEKAPCAPSLKTLGSTRPTTASTFGFGFTFPTSDD
uniref:JmjC domain-containing protein n=1 Tax=Hyaloperonospora arabidopsidis (strain Emoy2) TaxID=559515 RepID=M4BBI9_HYAAE